jgi:glycosyltransferase involved in cell wall biosynthesis
MNILIVHNTYRQPGGEDVVVAQESTLLEKNGHRVTIYARNNEEIDELSLGEKLGLIGRIISAKDTKLSVRRLIRDLKPDLVPVHNTFAVVSPSVFEACHEEDVPVVHTLHNYRLLCPAATFYRDGRNCQECVTRSLLSSVQHACYRDSRVISAAVALMLKTHRARQTWNRRIDAYIALSRFAKNRFVQCGIPANKIYVKPNFVDPDPGERSGPGDFALFVGRLVPEKGASTLLKAWQLLPCSIPLVIAGDGPMRGPLESEIAEKGLQSVRLAGQLGRSAVYDLMKRAAFLIVPSAWEEPFGLVVAEAFACGTPALAASVGGIPEMVDDQVTGLRFAPDDPKDLAKKISWAWNHPPEMAAMGKAARKVYERRYTGSANYEFLMDIYASAIDAHFRFKKKHPLRAAA